MLNVAKKYERVLLVLLFIWVIYNLAVLLQTGFIGDDAYNSQIKGAILQQGISLNDRILVEIEGWIKGSGRFLVLVWYMTYGIYYVTQNTVIIKAITIAIILGGILFFYIFSKRETGSSDLALLACFLIPVFFQFRLWHDPILLFTFLIPIIFMLTMGALVLFQKYLDREGLRYYFISAGMYLMALLMYEVAYPLCLLFLAIAYVRSRNMIKAIKQSLPFTVPAGLLLAASAVIRLSLNSNKLIQSTYPGADLHLDLDKLISAFEIQTSSTIPLIYYFFNKEHLATKLYSIDYLVLTLFWCGIAILIYKIGTSSLAPKFASWVTSGVLLLFLPAALSSLSGHQVELNQAGYGFGYITVYIQYFGLCALIVAIVVFIARKIKGGGVIILAIVVSAGITVVAAKNLKLNRAVALKTNVINVYPRHLLKAALEAGIADDMKDGAFLFRIMRYPSDWMWFYSTVTGKKFEVCDLSDTANYKACIAKIQSAQVTHDVLQSGVHGGIEVLDLSIQPVWILSYNFEKKAGKTGRVILGKVDRLVQNSQSKSPVQIIVSRIKVYDLQRNAVQKLNFEDAPVNFLKIVAEQTTDMSEVAPLNHVALLASDIGVEWLGKVYAREGTDNSNLHWSSGSATLMLHNLTDKPKRVVLTMGLGTPTTPASKLSVEYAGKTEILTLGQTPITYSKTLLLTPGSTEIKFTSDAKPIQNGDPRNIVFGIFNFKINDISIISTTHN